MVLFFKIKSAYIVLFTVFCELWKFDSKTKRNILPNLQNAKKRDIWLTLILSLSFTSFYFTKPQILYTFIVHIFSTTVAQEQLMQYLPCCIMLYLEIISVVFLQLSKGLNNRNYGYSTRTRSREHHLCRFDLRKRTELITVEHYSVLKLTAVFVCHSENLSI